ncbi:MAG: dihydrodipicolinate synthase family protein, partial [Lachnospiraceae bacterium]|nr:dihydrodipicolinate synthase family protein [Lachnospiraceae bacterium]
MKKMFGVCVAMTTSFDKNGNVDFEEMNRHAEMLIRNGVHGLYPNGTTGECMHLTIAERKRLAEEMVKTAAGRVVVFSQVGAPTLEETIELAKHAEACGCDGIGVVTPFYHGVTDREMEEFYVDVASAVSENFPVYIYNIPACSGNDIKPEVAKRVMERCKNVIGIKYSSPDVRRTMDYLKIGDVSFMHG